jgi:hypothetical protein
MFALLQLHSTLSLHSLLNGVSSTIQGIRLEVLTAVMMSVLFFWVEMPCELVGSRRNIQSPFSALKIETVCVSETLVSTYKSTRRY